MRFIKITHVSGNVLHVNVEHLIAFWEQDNGTTRITLTNNDNFGHVKETPEEIIQLIKQAKEI